MSMVARAAYVHGGWFLNKRLLINLPVWNLGWGGGCQRVYNLYVDDNEQLSFIDNQCYQKLQKMLLLYLKKSR